MRRALATLSLATLLLGGCGAHAAVPGAAALRGVGAYQAAGVHLVPLEQVDKLPLTVSRLTRTGVPGPDARDVAFEVVGRDANGPVYLAVRWHKRNPHQFDGDSFTAVRNFQAIASEQVMDATLAQLAKAELPAGVEPAVVEELATVVKAHFQGWQGDHTDPADAKTYEPVSGVKLDFAFKDPDPRVENALHVVGRRAGKPYELVIESAQQRVDGQPQLGHDLIRVKLNGRALTRKEVQMEYTALRFATFANREEQQHVGIPLGWIKATFGGGWTLIHTEFPAH